MAVQFNLLPDVKLEFNRSQHLKKVVYTVSFLSIAVAVGLTVVSFLAVNVLQKQLLNKANDDITTYTNKLKSIPNLDKILTIQNQLNTLPGLQKKKHLTSRLFTYLPALTPTNVFIGKMTVDTTANTAEIDGTADSVETVNRFIDTLKFTTYATEAATGSVGTATTTSDTTAKDTKNAFTGVVLTRVNRNDKNASYTVDFSFDPALFDATQSITMIIPQKTTTRSVLDSPSLTTLFNGQTGTTDKKGTQ